MPNTLKKWISIQLGSREHYAIPRVLEKAGQLSLFLTDSWVSPRWQPVVAKVSRSLAFRHHAEIPRCRVRASTLGRVAFDLSLVARRVAEWEGIYRRNHWFQNWTARHLTRHSPAAEVCFSYSYAARLPFKVAKERGMTCILGQIDPGPLEQEIVDEEASQYESLKLDQSAPPEIYWEEWREELELANTIIVNSAWSHELLIRQGVSGEKIRVVPLAYQGVRQGNLQREPSTVRPSDKPLTVLFLGQVILRKGVGQLFDAIQMLRDQPIRFVFAGPIGIKVPAEIRANPAVQVLGPVDRSQATELYRSSDLFILPTLSDGFAITQLEAMAHGLPVIASRFCGDVVTHGVNGHLLNEVSPEAIAGILSELQDDPARVEFWKENCRVDERYSLPSLAEALQKLG